MGYCCQVESNRPKQKMELDNGSRNACVSQGQNTDERNHLVAYRTFLRIAAILFK